MQALIPCDLVLVTVSSMKCIRFDVCKADTIYEDVDELVSSMKCIRFDVCKIPPLSRGQLFVLLNEVHTF